MNQLDTIKQIVNEAYNNGSLSKMRLTGLKPTAEAELREIIIRPISIKDQVLLQFVYRHITNDLTKNYDIEAALSELSNNLKSSFYFLSIVTRDRIYQLDQKKNRITKSKNQSNKKSALTHNRSKNTLISQESKFFQKLGITSKSGHILKGKEAKFRQINRFVELLKPHLPTSSSDRPYTVVDMGCGKGYLTFALYDYLTNVLGHAVEMKGIDQREKLMTACNIISKEANYNGLVFEQGFINDHEGELDILIALHACDTTTDDVIIKGIESKAQLIVCSPCCHKQVRKSMNIPKQLSGIANYGILVERQAELITDSIRTLLLNHFGYKTKIVEFISGEHTPKNLMIIAEKKQPISQDDKFLKDIEQIKRTFGVQEHYIERILTN